MGDVSLEFIGAQLRAIQAEQRTLRMGNELIRKEVARLASDIIRAVADRIASFKAIVETRLDQQAERLNQRLEQHTGIFNQRLDQQTGIFNRYFERLSAQIAGLANKGGAPLEWLSGIPCRQLSGMETREQRKDGRRSPV